MGLDGGRDCRMVWINPTHLAARQLRANADTKVDSLKMKQTDPRAITGFILKATQAATFQKLYNGFLQGNEDAGTT